MTDFTITIGYDGQLGRIAQQIGTNAVRLVQRAAQQALPRIEADILPILTQEPPPSDGVAPNWASERQRKAYFATDGFGAGIPYQRTGGLARAWEVFAVDTPTGATIVVQNPNPAARFVYGRFNQFSPQQYFHVVTGWLSAQDYRDDVISAFLTYFAAEMYNLAPEIILKSGLT